MTGPRNKCRQNVDDTSSGGLTSSARREQLNPCAPFRSDIAWAPLSPRGEGLGVRGPDSTCSGLWPNRILQSAIVTNVGHSPPHPRPLSPRGEGCTLPVLSGITRGHLVGRPVLRRRLAARLDGID